MAHRTVARDLRRKLRGGRYGRYGLPWTTEAAMELVSEGLIYRAPGRGTVPLARELRHLRRFGPVEDLMGLCRQDMKAKVRDRVRPYTDELLTATWDHPPALLRRLPPPAMSRVA